MPRAEIFGPQRRSIVSSIPTTTGPSGTNTATSQRSRARAIDRPDQRARLSTPWKRAKSVLSRRPSTDSTAVTVRRPGARTAPVTRTRTRSQVGLVKKAANGTSQYIRIGGTGSIGGLRLFIADNHHRAGASPWPVPIPVHPHGGRPVPPRGAASLPPGALVDLDRTDDRAHANFFAGRAAYPKPR